MSVNSFVPLYVYTVNVRVDKNVHLEFRVRIHTDMTRIM